MSEVDPDPYQPDQGQGSPNSAGTRSRVRRPDRRRQTGEIGEAPSVAADEPHRRATPPGWQRRRGAGRAAGCGAGSGRLSP